MRFSSESAIRLSLLLGLSLGLSPHAPLRLTAADCNANGVEDAQDILAGTSPDCNANEIPDECDLLPSLFSLKEAGRHEAEGSVQSVVASDLDGDHALDLIGVSPDSEIIIVLLGAGDGTFAPGATFTAGVRPGSLAVGDLDGDLDLDIVVANSGASDVSVLLGAGDGSFAPQVAFSVGLGPVSVALGDLDGDLDLDLATANSGSDDISVLLNAGDGSFAPARSLAAGDSPSSLVAGDLDGDGDLDLVTANWSSGDLSVLLNAGDGTFPPAVSIPVGTWPSSVALGDLDQDLDLDLAVANAGSNYTSVLLGAGDGTFAPARSFPVGDFPRAVVTADMDGDGDLDLVVANQNSSSVSVLFNAGDGAFSPPAEFPVGGCPEEVSTGDLDGDGDLDVAVAEPCSGDVVVLVNAPVPSSRDCNENRVPDECESDCNGNGIPDDCDVASGTSPDCDRNGIPDSCDLASGASPDCNSNGVPDGCELDPDMRFIRLEAAGSFSTGVWTGSYHGAAADLDGDGDLDLATANATTDDVSVALNRGDGTFLRRVRRFPAGDGPWQVAAADLDGDGDIDLATANTFSEDVTVLLNDGEGSFALGASLPVGYSAQWVIAADLDRDGSADLATANGVRGEDGVRANDIAVFLNDGRGGFGAPPRRYLAGRQPSSLAAADIDGDGDLDLATANSESGDVSVFRNLGDGSFAAPIGYAVGAWPMSLVMADLQGDGRVDLAVAGSKDITVLLNGGGGDFGAATHCTLDITAASHLAAVDLDGDGDVDLVAGGSKFGSPHILAFLNDGDGTFGFTLALPMGHQPRVLLAEDLDGNGLADLAIVNMERGRADAVTVLLNYGGPDANQNGIPDGCEEDCNGNRIPDDVDIAGGSSRDCNHNSVPDECEVRRVLEGFREVQVGAVVPGPVTLADLDGDGSLDLVATIAAVRTEGQGLGVFRNDGAGGFKETQRLEYDRINYSAGDYVGADLNGDGAMDLAGRNQNGRFSLFFSDGYGRLQDPVEDNWGADSVAAGDLDGDGDIDVAMVHAGSPLVPSTNVVVRWNEGDGTFSPGVLFELHYQRPSSVVAVDFDGDGDLDLSTSGCQMVLNDGQKGFARSWTVGLYAVPGDRNAFADMDDDGGMDLIGASVSSELIHVSLNRGDGNFRTAVDGTPLPVELPATGLACSAIGVTDLDGDGDIDILYGTGSSLGVFWNEGDAYFRGPEIFDMAVSCVSTADLDGDGFPDLATVAPSGLLTVWLAQHGYPLDCNRNGLPDPCDIGGGRSRDLDGNGVPDECEVKFLRGDSNDDGEPDLSDAVFILGWLFLGEASPGCVAASNVNGDSDVDLSDAVALLGHLFLGGPDPVAPFPECGPGLLPEDAALGCLTTPETCR